MHIFSLIIFLSFLLIHRVEPGDYLNTFAFLDKLAENLTKKQAQSRL